MNISAKGNILNLLSYQKSLLHSFLSLFLCQCNSTERKIICARQSEMEVRAHQLPEVLCSYMYKRRECKGNDACNYWVPFCLYPSFFVRAQCLKLPIKCCVLVLGHCFFTAFPSTSLESGTAHCYAKREEPDVG